jgi:hypothetical protein
MMSREERVRLTQQILANRGRRPTTEELIEAYRQEARRLRQLVDPEDLLPDVPLSKRGFGV